MCRLRGVSVSMWDAGFAFPAAGHHLGMTDPQNAPDPDSDEFLENQNTVEKVSPGTTADAPATDPELIPTDPTSSED